MNIVIEGNTERINATFILLPGVVTNINDAALGVKESLAAVNGVVGSFDGTFLNTSAAVHAGTESIMGIIALLSPAVRTIMNIFPSKKKT